jgi:hypothetical protein
MNSEVIGRPSVVRDDLVQNVDQRICDFSSVHEKQRMVSALTFFRAITETSRNMAMDFSITSYEQQAMKSGFH